MRSYLCITGAVSEETSFLNNKAARCVSDALGRLWLQGPQRITSKRGSTVQNFGTI